MNVLECVDFRKETVITSKRKKRMARKDGQSSQPLTAFLLKRSGHSVGYGRKSSDHMLGREGMQHNASVREDGPRGQSLDPCPPPHTQIPSLVDTVSNLLVP